MANKQGLRELQTRLAERLAQAKTQAPTGSWLAVEASGQSLLLPLQQSGEIFPWVSILPVPYTRPWFLGVANLRGGLYGVVDFASFASGKAAPARSEAARLQSRFVALNAALGVNCAILIDKLSGLRNATDFVSFEESGDAPAYLGRTLVDKAGKRWQELDMSELAKRPDFLGIAS
jgi:twitching motility protein PilI